MSNKLFMGIAVAGSILMLWLTYLGSSTDKGFLSDRQTSVGIVVEQRAVLNDEENGPLMIKAMKYIKSGDYPSAVATYENIIKQSPEEHTAYHGLGSSLFNQGKFQEAELRYYEAISLNEEYADPWVGIGAVENKKGNYTLAIEAFSKSIKINPKLGAAYYSRARVYYDTKQWDNAETDFESTIKLIPNSEYAKNAKIGIQKIKEKRTGG